MSSLALDRPSDGTSPQRGGAAPALAPDGGPRLRRTPVPAAGKAATEVPAPRPVEGRPAGRRPRPAPRPAEVSPAEVPPAAAAPATAAPAARGGVETADLVFLRSPLSLVKQIALVRRATPEAARPQGGRHPRLVPAWRRRPTLYVAAALVAGLGSGGSVIGPSAQADPAGSPSHSMSVAQELGISAQDETPVADAADTRQLQEVAASRASREAQQAAAARLQQDADEAARQAAIEAARPKAVLPVNGARLTSTFGSRWGTLHAGIDLAAPIGTPECAAMDGVVLEAGPASGFGLAVYIQHQNGDVTVYGHMEKILVRAGQVVKAGDTIALLGNNGQSTGPHLHFEVHIGGITGPKVDPIPWLRERGIGL
jgi:murein DD-endopeptidase MepM/ murein hydrolase activator NlpD